MIHEFCILKISRSDVTEPNNSVLSSFIHLMGTMFEMNSKMWVVSPCNKQEQLLLNQINIVVDRLLNKKRKNSFEVLKFTHYLESKCMSPTGEFNDFLLTVLNNLPKSFQVGFCKVLDFIGMIEKVLTNKVNIFIVAEKFDNTM